jgi:hypothetical protein
VGLVLSAIVVPLAVSGHDLVNRRALAGIVGPALKGTYLAGFAVSLLFWGLGFEAVRDGRRWVRVAALSLLAFTAAFGIGGQTAFRHLTNGYVNRDALMLALSMPGIILGFVGPHAGELATAFLIPALLVVALALGRARYFGPRTRHTREVALAAFAALPLAMFLPFHADWYQCLPPDMLWMHGSGGPLLSLVKLQDRPKTLPPGKHQALPEVLPIQADRPSIIVLFGESVRRDEVCSRKAEGCALSPALDAAAPDRIGYDRAFAISSCTELSSATIWSGLPITASPEAFATAPLLWDYAKARGYRTAYVASQNLLFGQLGFYLRSSRIDLLREACDRTAAPPLDLGTDDEISTKEALAFLEAGGPSLVFVHFSNTHNPYRTVKEIAPFPTAGVSAPERERNTYRNSLAHNDRVIGDFLRALRAGEQGRRAIVISLSDHGEAWGEHRSFKHTFDVFSEQIDVPLWIDAPPGSLPDELLARLRSEAPRRPTTNLDVAATVIDLLGALDEPAFRAHTAALGGVSLLRPLPVERDVLLWNCPPFRVCPLEAHGVVRFPRKLHYIGREAHHECYDIDADPREQSPLPLERCADLRAESERLFGPSLDVRAPGR